MFLTRQDFEDCLNVLKAYENLKTEEQVKILLANDMAKQLFPDFNKMNVEEQADVLNMIIQDMSIELYRIN
jgi:hypothetical protein